MPPEPKLHAVDASRAHLPVMLSADPTDSGRGSRVIGSSSSDAFETRSRDEAGIDSTEKGRRDATRDASDELLAHLPHGAEWVQVDAIRMTAIDECDPVTWKLSRRSDIQGRAHR
jgi:hypothetical protein